MRKLKLQVTKQLPLPLAAPPVTAETPLVPARMVNEFVYCPRLAYLMWTQAEWADTGDTVEGRRGHARVDKPGPPLPAPAALEADEVRALTDTETSRRTTARHPPFHSFNHTLTQIIR